MKKEGSTNNREVEEDRRIRSVMGRRIGRYMYSCMWQEEKKRGEERKKERARYRET